MKPGAVAANIDAAIRALAVPNTPNVREVRRRFSQQLAHSAPAFMFELAHILVSQYGHREVAYELLRSHAAASFGWQGSRWSI